MRLAFKLFDSEGVALLQTMEGGSRAVNALRGELRALGGVITEEQADKLAGLNDSWNRLKTAFTGLGRLVIELLAPAFSLLADAIAKTISYITKAIKTILLLDDAIATLGIRVGNFFKLIDDDTKNEALGDMSGKWNDIWNETQQANKELKDYKVSVRIWRVVYIL